MIVSFLCFIDYSCRFFRLLFVYFLYLNRCITEGIKLDIIISGLAFTGSTCLKDYTGG